ncbi:hypothetical protein [Gluconobacter albidus]|uniref:hypothetical protein n=1 Tax=Gluconobacter albidus TaxID=318683 RepID=UPI001B8BA9F5|nr:hypothetical protein [Gluconobacter albidus]MBS1029235.1 hypothetical protein [Gluconobacter albidus]
MTKALAPAGAQGSLALTIAKEIEVEGIGMGVLSDGTPYLTARGLAAFCGVHHSVIQDLGAEWAERGDLPRIGRIKSLIEEQGISLEKPFIPISVAGSLHNAYPESVCMAVLEYYAFDSKQVSNSHAQTNYRRLARKSFRDFIYTQTGYSPTSSIPAAWQQFHDRVSLAYNKVPDGYFSIFKEMSDMIVTLIQSGANIGSDFVPDISVGLTWSAYWKKSGLKDAHGDRREYIHSYPDYFPQAVSNPQKPYCYPDECLPAFRSWMREIYLPTKFPAYLEKKVKQGAIPPSFAELSILALTNKMDPSKLKKS